MSRKILVMAMCLSLTVVFSFYCLAQDDDPDITFECCCYVNCCYKFQKQESSGKWVWRTACRDLTGEPICKKSDIIFQQLCESDLQATWVCLERLADMREEINRDTEILKWRNFQYDYYEGECSLDTVCPVEMLLGIDNPNLETLRNFRDTVLSQTIEGQELIKLYYQLSPAIVMAMERDEQFKEELKQMIDGVLPMIGERLSKKSKFAFL